MSYPHSRLDWRRDGADWPLREHSRFVEAAGVRWHVQSLGAGPVALLLHGVGGATHSWRGVAPRLADRFTVVAPDLPGHGFSTQGPHAARTLPGMAAALAALCRALQTPPTLIVGHSAGAAVAARMALDGAARPEALVAFNGAFLPFKGLAGVAFPSIARLMALNPFSAPIMAAGARGDAVARLMGAMGARDDGQGAALYRRLFASSGHVAAALNMMAAWDLRGLVEAMAGLTAPLTMIAGAADRAVPLADAQAVAARVPAATLSVWPGFGHLAHEDDPVAATDAISTAFDNRRGQVV